MYQTCILILKRTFFLFFKLTFEPSEEIIDLKIIGTLFYNSNASILNRLKYSKPQSITIETTFNACCLLPNKTWLLINFYNGHFYLYDNTFKLINIITNEKIYCKALSIATNNIDRIYICDWKYHRILMVDLEFNFISSVGELFYPRCVYFHENSVYVCDTENKRIKKLTADLVLLESYKLDFKPWQICIENVACVRAINKSEIYFYDLCNFELKFKYDQHNGCIFTAGRYFYEYFNGCFFCYDCDGRFVDEFEKRFDGSYKESDVFIQFLNDQFIILNGKIKNICFL